MILDEVKVPLRISQTTTAYDKELNILINACIVDLRLAGVAYASTISENPLIKHAIIIYCKAYFGHDPDSEKFKASYEHMKISLALAGDIDE